MALATNSVSEAKLAAVHVNAYSESVVRLARLTQSLHGFADSLMGESGDVGCGADPKVGGAVMASPSLNAELLALDDRFLSELNHLEYALERLRQFF